MSRFLAACGIFLLALASLGLLLDRDATLVSAFAVLGTGLVVIAVLSPRMVGEQQIGPGGIKLILDEIREGIEATDAALRELAAGASPEPATSVLPRAATRVYFSSSAEGDVRSLQPGERGELLVELERLRDGQLHGEQLKRGERGFVARAGRSVIFFTPMEPGEFRTDTSGTGILITGIRKVATLPISDEASP